MKTFLKIIAWMGAGVMTTGIIISLLMSSTQNYPAESFLNIYLIGGDMIGLPLMLVGGLIAKPDYIWWISIIIGILHILPWLIMMIISGIGIGDSWELFMVFLLVPGMVALLGGILINLRRNQEPVLK